MRIAQIILPSASLYERRSQRADQAALAGRNDVALLTLSEVRAAGANVAHVYATGELPAASFVGFPIPYVAPAALGQTRWSWRKAAAPTVVVTPDTLPEAVDDRYFAAALPSPRRRGEESVVGSFARASTANQVEQTVARIHRFRDDVIWKTFSEPPSPEDLAGVDLWVDPAVEEGDFDGFVAEALVIGLPVVAARIAVNAHRLEEGRTGMLVPPRDPNEMTHAILSILFRSEVAERKIRAARQTASKFRLPQRLRALERIYESIRG